MKRLCSLLIGLCVLTSATNAYALTTTPISQHYVQPVINRVNTGMGNLSGLNVPNFNLVFYDWLMRLSSTFLELVDTELRIVEQQRDLYKITPCLHLDLIILEQKIEEVRTVTRDAFRNKRIFDIVMLQSMTRFLNDRYSHLVFGGRDNNYDDPQFNWHYMFDTLTWCCPDQVSPAICTEQDRATCLNNGGLAFKTVEDCSAHPSCEEPAFIQPDERICPFHSDYLPPTIEGYGCDRETLDNGGIGGHPPNQAERDALDDFLQKRDTFLNNMAFIGPMTAQIHAVTGRPPPDLSRFLAALGRVHKTRIGCSLFDGHVPPPVIREFDSPPNWPVGAAKWELRGPFFITTDELYLVRGLYDQLKRWGGVRDQADYLMLPSEYPPGTPERTVAETREQNMHVIKQLIRNFVRAFFRVWNVEQAALETRPVIQSGDSQKEISNLSIRLRGTMIEFYELASQKDKGMRKFSVKFGYFLRRTCVFRPCNLMLDRMLKITLEDACFPYVNGAFKGNLQHHETCKTAARVGESF